MAGVYGFYLPELKQWLYVGQSTNIKKRFASRRHPYHLALSLAQPVEFYYVERAERRGRLEAALHRDLTPLGNGGVSTFSSHDCWAHPMHWAITGGVACSPQYSACLFVNERDRMQVFERSREAAPPQPATWIAPHHPIKSPASHRLAGLSFVEHSMKNCKDYASLLSCAIAFFSARPLPGVPGRGMRWPLADCHISCLPFCRWSCQPRAIAHSRI